MKIAQPLAGALLLSLASLAGAQTTSSEQVAQPTAPVSSANAQVGADVAGQQAITATMNAHTTAQYNADIAAYRRSLRQHHRAVVRSNRQEIAYANAMRDWRIQTADCKRGILRACSAPTPDPANYY